MTIDTAMISFAQSDSSRISTWHEGRTIRTWPSSNLRAMTVSVAKVSLNEPVELGVLLVELGIDLLQVPRVVLTLLLDHSEA